MSASIQHSIEAVDHAITSRRSVRRFRPESVPRHVVAEILQVAARAPSGTNAQPWEVSVLIGEPLRRMVDALLAVHNDKQNGIPHLAELQPYPDEWKSPFIDRRRKLGWDLYGLLGIKKGDAEKMSEQTARNYRFFDAPVGMIFTIERAMAKSALLDYGAFLQNVMVAARARGLDTCCQAALATYHDTVRSAIDVGTNKIVVCGMALGYADVDAPENQLRTEREAVQGFARFFD